MVQTRQIESSTLNEKETKPESNVTNKRKKRFQSRERSKLPVLECLKPMMGFKRFAPVCPNSLLECRGAQQARS